jgi:peptidyl-prolyl cis-trans isomerase SurA
VNLKRWATMIVVALALVACANPAVGATVARVDNIVLTQQDLDQRIALFKAGVQAGQQVPADEEIGRVLVGYFVQEHLVLGLARQRGVAIEGQEIDNQIAQIRTNIANQGGSNLDEIVRGQLGLPGENSSEFRGFVSSLVAQNKLAETLVTTDTVRQELTAQMMAQVNEKVDQVHAAHILLTGEAQATQVLELLNQGQTFEALASEFSQDPGSAANGGDLGWIQQGQTLPELDQVFFSLQPGEISKTPVQTQLGFHIIKIIAREQRAMMTQEEAQQALEIGLAQELQTRRGQALQQLLAEEREKAKAEQRLVEPVYAEPTPAPAP